MESCGSLAWDWEVDGGGVGHEPHGEGIGMCVGKTAMNSNVAYHYLDLPIAVL